MDEHYVILELNAKVRRGPPSDEDLEPFIEKHFAPNCILFTDKADGYKRMAKKHPELIKYLRQVNHSKGEFTRYSISLRKLFFFQSLSFCCENSATWNKKLFMFHTRN